MGIEKDNGHGNRSCENCLWGDKCRDVKVKAYRLADIPCDDYWEIDDDSEIEDVIESERVAFMERWNEYEKDWEWDD